MSYQKIKTKVIDVASDVMSAPARMKANRMIRQTNQDVKAIKAYQAIKGKPIEPYNESNPDFRTKMNAINATVNSEKRLKRLTK